MSSQKIGTINGEGEFQKDKEANQVWFEEDLEVEQLFLHICLTSMEYTGTDIMI
jgi:hypothetical protein